MHHARNFFAAAGMAAVVGSNPQPGNAQTQALIDRGGYLVNTILACGNCHTPKNEAGMPVAGRELSGGGLSFTTPAFNATAANITPDRETGIGSWSDEDIKSALRQGIRPDHGRNPGTPLAAVMPAGFYKAILPGDLDAIIAYLRSIPAVRNEVPAPLYKLPVRRDPYPEAEKGFAESSLASPVRRGAYLVTIGHCMECHAAWTNGVPDYQHGLGKGGRQFGPVLVQGFAKDWQHSVAANITSHPTSGIGSWTDQEIKRAITKGIARDGRTLQPPMPFSWYAGLNPSDLTAIVALLRTLPPLE
jgi:mono/diheme cytochrome c family protein